MLLVLAISALAAAAYLVAEAATLPARQRRVALRRAATYGRLRLSTREERESFRERVLEPAEQRLASWVLRADPRASVDAVTAKLLAAGMGRKVSPTKFLAAKAALAISLFLVGGLYGRSGAGLLGAVVSALVAGGLAFHVPDFLLSMRAKRRKEEVCRALPDALDLLAVSVEAGLGFDGAIAKLTEHTDGPLAEEFGLALNEMRIGESRAEALRRMADRVAAPELAGFVRAVIQSDQLGMSLGRILRVQAADSRHRRQAAAEERAMKAPIKMLFPTVLFIFPGMFIVILAPAVMNFGKVF
jgi:tight adherence protein C